MSEFYDLAFDHEEYAKQLAYTDELSRHDLSEPRPAKKEEGRGLTRRDLLVKTGMGAAAVAGLGALAGPAAAKTAKSGAFTGTLNVISLGVEWVPGAQEQA